MKADSELAQQFQAGEVRHTLVYVVCFRRSRARSKFSAALKHTVLTAQASLFHLEYWKTKVLTLKPCLLTDGMNLWSLSPVSSLVLFVRTAVTELHSF